MILLIALYPVLPIVLAVVIVAIFVAVIVAVRNAEHAATRRAEHEQLKHDAMIRQEERQSAYAGRVRKP